MWNSSCDNGFSCIGMNDNPNPADVSWMGVILPPVAAKVFIILLHSFRIRKIHI